MIAIQGKQHLFFSFLFVLSKGVCAWGLHKPAGPINRSVSFVYNNSNYTKDENVKTGELANNSTSHRVKLCVGREK